MRRFAVFALLAVTSMNPRLISLQPRRLISACRRPANAPIASIGTTSASVPSAASSRPCRSSTEKISGALSISLGRRVRVTGFDPSSAAAPHNQTDANVRAEICSSLGAAISISQPVIYFINRDSGNRPISEVAAEYCQNTAKIPQINFRASVFALRLQQLVDELRNRDIAGNVKIKLTG